MAAVDRWAAAAAGPHGLAISVALAAVSAVIAAGIFVPAASKPTLALAGVVALAVRVLGENFGMILTGRATDPSTGRC